MRTARTAWPPRDAGVDGFEAQLTDQVTGHAFGFLVVAADEHDGLPGNSGWFIIGAPIWFIALHTRARRAWGQGHRRCLRMPSGGHPLAVIGGKWKAVLIFHMMHSGTHRFAELRRKTRGISERVLSRQLRELESDGIGWWGW